MDAERREAIDRMFRARLSWTLLGGVGLVGLTSGLGVPVRGGILAVALGVFLWLNQPLAAWVVAQRRKGDARWQPAAVGLGLRCLALCAVIWLSW